MKSVSVFTLLAALPAAPALGANILQPGDAVIAIDAIPNSTSSYPGGEAPGFAFDGNTGTKYLNFGGSGTGFIVTPGFGSSTVQSLALSTANDAPERDPLSYMLYGTNDAILSTDNSTGNGGEVWSLISDNVLAPPAARQTAYPIVDFANATPYTSYKLLFPTLSGPTGIMQISEAQLFTGTAGTGSGVLAFGDSVLAIDDFTAPPANEDAPNAIDGDNNTKYLNFGEEGTGIIVTPASGPSVAKGLQLVTANDFPDRDPASFEVYGTDDPITSQMWGAGEDENWVLIDSGSLDLPDDRLAESEIAVLGNSTPYTSYRIVFPTVKDAGTANSFQVAEIRLLDVPEPGSLALLGLGGLLVVRRRR